MMRPPNNAVWQYYIPTSTQIAAGVICSLLILPICCQSVPAVPVIISAVLETLQIIDAIDTYIHGYFTAKPDPQNQAQIQDALEATRRALRTAIRASNAVDTTQEEQEAALAHLKHDYDVLLVLIKPLGVHPAMTTMEAQAAGLVVPTSQVFAATVHR